MKTIIWDKASAGQKAQALARPLPPGNAEIVGRVSAILREVKERGDDALHDFTLKFDGVSPKTLRVPAKALDAAAFALNPELRTALRRAKSNIEKFHKAELPKSVMLETMPGVKCALLWRAIENVGLYIPAGTAPLFSALLMLAIPARIAGCKNIVVCVHGFYFDSLEISKRKKNQKNCFIRECRQNG